jgi:mono/diheme cytochrome c family protein
MSTTPRSVNPPPVSIIRLAALLMPVLVAAACGGSSRAELSPAGESGRRIANTSGCASCHGADGTGGVGPGFVGLYGSQVTLADGSTVVADDEYLRRSITDPEAELVEGYALKMPVTDLSADEIEDLLAYIRELGPPP